MCRPIRTRNGSGNGHTSASSARCAATAATPPPPRSRTQHGTHHPSSSPHTRRAPRSPRGPTRHDAPTPRASRPDAPPTERVEPSMSVNKNVTVPDGNSLTTTPDGPQPRTQSKSGKTDHVTYQIARTEQRQFPTVQAAPTGVVGQVHRGGLSAFCDMRLLATMSTRSPNRSRARSAVWFAPRRC